MGFLFTDCLQGNLLDKNTIDCVISGFCCFFPMLGSWGVFTEQTRNQNKLQSWGSWSDFSTQKRTKTLFSSFFPPLFHHCSFIPYHFSSISHHCSIIFPSFSIIFTSCSIIFTSYSHHFPSFSHHIHIIFHHFHIIITSCSIIFPSFSIIFPPCHGPYPRHSRSTTPAMVRPARPLRWWAEALLVHFSAR